MSDLVALLPSCKSYLPILAGARGTMAILASCATPALNARMKKILSCTCKLDAGAGNPLFHADYWLNSSISGDPCTSTLGHYRYGYSMISI
jgi:hypothetical protein